MTVEPGIPAGWSWPAREHCGCQSFATGWRHRDWPDWKFLPVMR